MAKARAKARSAETGEIKQVFVIQPGAYQGRVMAMQASHADAALADGWGADTANAFYPNDTPIYEGDHSKPQSYLDWIAESHLIGEPEPPPEPDPAPVLSALTPNTAVSGDAADITMVVEGTGFTATSVIVFNGYDEPTTFISDTQVSTGVKPSIFVVPAVCPVEVRNSGGTSNSLDFEFTDAEAFS